MIPRTSIYNPTNMNEDDFYNEAVFVGKGGYYRGNTNYQCVNFAVGETCRLSNREVCYYNGISTKSDIEKPMFNRNGYGNAINWLKDTLWEKGDTPKLGAVMVYGSNYGSGLGHVRVVEKIDGNKLFIAGANENKQMAFKWIDKPTISENNFLGYIYNPFVENEMDLIRITKDPNYEYKWSVDGNKFGEDFDITTENGFSDTKLEEDNWELVLKVNGSLFYNYGTSYYACGLEKSRGINNQDVSMTAVSDYDSCMSIAGLDEDLYFGSQKWIIGNILDKSYCAITGLGLLLNGIKRDDMHKGFESQWNCKSGRTVIGEDTNGNILSLSFPGETNKSGLTCKELQDKCLELGFYNCIALDGGGSVFRWHDGEYDISSSRKVKNALLLYRRKKAFNQEDMEKLQEQYASLKYAYDLVVDTNEELKSMLDEKVNKIEKIKEVINE